MAEATFDAWLGQSPAKRAGSADVVEARMMMINDVVRCEASARGRVEEVVP